VEIIEAAVNRLASNTEIEFEKFIDMERAIDEALVDRFSALVEDSPTKDSSVYAKLKFLGEHFKETMTFFEMGIKYE
jgi:hypothetical protein